MKTQIKFTRVNNDVNGNPRYVCHFFNLLNDTEGYSSGLTVSQRYDIAVRRANKIGGRKFHNKQHGGGIVFQSYNIEQTERKIKELLNSN